jgi:hypothetical protein
MNKSEYAKKQQLSGYAQKVINRTKSKAKAQKESDIRTGKLKISKAIKPKTTTRRTKKK